MPAPIPDVPDARSLSVFAVTTTIAKPYVAIATGAR